jgi:hypothetical protein
VSGFLSGFLGIGGVNSKQQNASIGNLQNLFNFGLNTGQAGTSAGGANLGTAGSYYSNMLSGSRPAVLQAMAPETNTIQARADAQRRQLAATGTARGGGTAGTNQQQQTDVNAAIDNALFAARPAAAKGLTDVGGTQLNAANQALGIAGGAAGDAGKIATGARSQAGQGWQDIFSDIFGFGHKLGDQG